jgi:hypothetical protein
MLSFARPASSLLSEKAQPKGQDKKMYECYKERFNGFEKWVLLLFDFTCVDIYYCWAERRVPLPPLLLPLSFSLSSSQSERRGFQMPI